MLKVVYSEKKKQVYLVRDNGDKKDNDFLLKVNCNSYSQFKFLSHLLKSLNIKDDYKIENN